VFGGWAVDLYAGRLSRSHGDIDIAVWITDLDQIHGLLRRAGWLHMPQPDEDGYTQYVSEGIQLDLAFLARDDNAVVYTPTADGRGEWPVDAFGDDVATLSGVRARVISFSALLADKTALRPDPSTRAKDQADVVVLNRIQRDA
jgi:hypothetical protein